MIKWLLESEFDEKYVLMEYTTRLVDNEPKSKDNKGTKSLDASSS